MATFLLVHQHLPTECRYVFGAWQGFDSRLRHQATMSSCLEGAHRIVWTVEADDADAARALLPPYVAERTTVDKAREVPIP